MKRPDSRLAPLCARFLVSLLVFSFAGAYCDAFAAGSNLPNAPATYTPDVSYTLKTAIGKSGMAFVGVGGAIDGESNPTLHVNPGAIVQVTLIDGDGAEHDVSFPEFKALSDHVIGKGASTVIVFRADRNGTFNYFCTLPGHRQAGMEGDIVVGTGAATTMKPEAADISREPTDLPPPIGGRAPQLVTIHLYTEEVKGQLADNTTYNYWTFNGKVPGPFLRVRVSDTVELHLKNSAKSRMIHSIDLHAVTGPGGGAAVLQVPPGEEKALTFKALKPGLFVYHCATPMVANHIANGMYGMILVEPAGGLPKVDHEFYVMQGDMYTTGAFGQHGQQEFDVGKLLDEQPTYFVFNGAVGALTKHHPLKAKVGDTVRIYFGVGGPNFTSSFHVIGEIMDEVWPWGTLASPPTKDVQTIPVPPGGATIAQFQVHVPGKYILVDHALARMERGLAGFLEVSGNPQPQIYHAGEADK
jgi:nitrite reductase (NO-forming)